MEDVIEVILNLKRVRIKLFKNEPVTLSLSFKGQGDVTARDIKTTADVEVVNPDQKIATATDKKIEIEMELTVEHGVGYVPVEQRQKEKLSVGEIAIDGIFSPIKNTNFTVENIRVGQRTDYNKVILTIETDGSITPEEALLKASRVVLDHFEIINKIEVPENAPKETKESVKSAKKPAKKLKAKS